MSPLHWSVKFRRYNVTKILVENYKADVNRLDDCKRSPIFIAIENKDHDIAKVNF